MRRIVFVVIALMTVAPPALVYASHSSGADPGANALRDLAGTWLGIVELDALVPAHIETLELGADGRVVTEIWVERGGRRCPGRTALDEPLCQNPRRTARGRVAVDPSRGTMSIADLEVLGSGASLGGSDRAERLARAELWFGGGAEWTFVRRADLLTMSRSVRTDDRGSRPFVRALHRVDSRFATDLVDAIDALGESLGSVGCAIDVLHRDAAAWRAFRFRLRDIAKSHRADGAARARAERRELQSQKAGGELVRLLEDPAATRYASAVGACQRSRSRGSRAASDVAR